MCFLGIIAHGGEKHINKIPGQSRENFVYVFCLKQPRNSLRQKDCFETPDSGGCFEIVSQQGSTLPGDSGEGAGGVASLVVFLKGLPSWDFVVELCGVKIRAVAFLATCPVTQVPSETSAFQGWIFVFLFMGGNPPPRTTQHMKVHLIKCVRKVSAWFLFRVTGEQA